MTGVRHMSKFECNVTRPQAFAMGLDIDPENAALRDGLQGVSDDLTGDDLRKVLQRLYRESSDDAQKYRRIR